MIVVAALLAGMLAGCSDAGGTDAAEPDFDDVEIQDDKGLVRGVVVDQAISPLAGVDVLLQTGGEGLQATTDEEGRFVFADVIPGTHVVSASKAGYDHVQSSVDVVAGVKDPAAVKLQLTKLFEQDPFVEQFKMDGFIACSYHVSAGASVAAPCITDYTSILVPGGAAPDLRDVQGDTREYLMELGSGWQSMVIEMTWEPSASGTSPEMGGAASYEGRLATHAYSRFDGPAPLRVQIDEGMPGPGGDEPVPSEGLDDLIVFFSVRSGDDPVAVSVNQEFEVFHHTFYYGDPPEGWSFLAGDELPF